MKSYPGSESVFAVGNGRALMYLNGPAIAQLIGSPYSSPTALSMTPSPSGTWQSRIQNGIVTHTGSYGVISDCAAFSLPQLCRSWAMEKPLLWTVCTHGFTVTSANDLFEGYSAHIIKIPEGSRLYGSYSCRHDRYLLLLWEGSYSVALTETGMDVITSGRGSLMIVPGASYPECMENARAAVNAGAQSTFEAALRDDKLFTLRRTARMTSLKDHPLTKQALDAADDTAHLIRAQQGTEGGIQAGTNYHLAYIRDEYGAGRGLLAVGCPEEAKKILSFYCDTFTACGMLANAQGIGEPGVFHIHENDESEITGYLLHQASDLMDAVGDRDYIETLFPMLDWALDRQISVIHNDTLPFNGDETYVAGHIVPRTVLDEGSLEATELFISGARRYLAYRGGRTEVKALTDRLEASLAKNFFRNGIWYSNAPRRIEGLTYKPYRTGICLGGRACTGQGVSWWNTHVGSGLYLCSSCLARKQDIPAPRHDEQIHAKSVTLADVYMNMNLLPGEVLKREIISFLEEFRRDGYFSTCSGNSTCLGLDYGLHLYAAKQFGLEADDLLKATLDARDDTGAWTEYYDRGVPSGTPCRPWESGINIDSVIHYLKV